MKHLSLLILCFVVTAAAADSGGLQQPVEALRLEKVPMAAALRVLSRASGVPILAETDVLGDVTLDQRRGTLRSALSAVVGPAGYTFEETSEGVLVRNRRTVLYPIDYPQLTRSGSGSASITLGGANNGNYSAYPAGVPAGASQNGNHVSAPDATQIAIQQENQNTFWNGLEAELRAMLRDGDTLILNKFSGVAQVYAPEKRQQSVREYLKFVNHRITRQVEIEARIVEVALRDERKLGIDWELAASTVGAVSLSGSGTTDVAGVGGALLSGNSFIARLGNGEASAVIQALQQQGEVKTVAQPRLRTLNNQTSVIKVGEDRPFFRLQQSTTFQQGGTSVPVNQTQEQYSVSTITIGTILAVTPQIDGQDMITLDVLPAITRLQAIVTSPDGKQTAPLTEVKQASTIVRLKDGETAVIGGLISEDTGTITRAVPVLGSIPVAGRAFQTKATLKNRTELVIFLTPKLVR